jgi:hypothetical protein
MSEMPDRLYMGEDDRSLYDKLETENMFKGKTRKEQFLFAMSFGFKHKIKRALIRKEGLFLAKDLHPEDEALINAVAIYDTNSLQVLTDKGAAFKIAEEYAHAGIRLLTAWIDSVSFGSVVKQLEKELHDMYNRLGGDHEQSPTR